MSNDELKNLFNDAFEGETIAFDNDAWKEMQSMLDRERRRRAFWIWLSGGTSVGIIALFCAFIMFEAKAIYNPRTTIFTPSDHLFTDSGDQSTNTTLTRPELPSSSQVENEVKSTPTTNSTSLNRSKGQLIASSNENSKGGATTLQAPKEKDPKENQIVTPGPKAESPEIEEIINTKGNYLALLPPLDLSIDTPESKLEQRNEKEPEFKSPIEPFVRFGLSNALTKNVGLIGGIGVSQPLKNGLILSGEVLMARDHTAYFIEQQTVNYGFDQRESSLRIWTKEMVTLEVPLFLHYRLKRFKIGTGVSAGLLLSSKVQEERINGASENNTLGEVTEIGYVSWNALQPLQLSIPIDVQYQLNERYFIGSRYNFGLTDVFSETNEFDRRQRLELYIKMKIQR